jgi:hypothetical protein
VEHRRRRSISVGKPRPFPPPPSPSENCVFPSSCIHLYLLLMHIFALFLSFFCIDEHVC